MYICGWLTCASAAHRREIFESLQQQGRNIFAFLTSYLLEMLPVASDCGDWVTKHWSAERAILLEMETELLHQYCQNWSLTVSMKKTKIITIQKRSRFQKNDPTFKIGGTHIEQTNTYTYLGLQISSTGNLCSAMKELKEKAKRAFYAIKHSVQIQIPIRTWHNIFKSVIESVALYGSKVWSSLAQNDWAKWDKNPIETLHAEFWENVLRVQRKTPNCACRAEWPFTFWHHKPCSTSEQLHYLSED